MRLRRLVSVLALVLLTAGCGGGPGDAGGDDAFAPQSGGRLADVTLEPLSGGAPLDLGELRGPAVVNVWASWCGPCEAELPMYEQFAQEHGDEVEVVGIAAEDSSEEAAREMARSKGVTYANYLDPDNQVRAIARPQLLLVDGSGRVAFSQYLEITGPDQLEDLAREHLGVDL